MHTNQFYFVTLLVAAAGLTVGCGDDTPNPHTTPSAGTWAPAGTGGGTLATAGTTSVRPPIGGAGSGAAGTRAGASGVGAAGMVAAGTGAAGMVAAGTGAAGMVAAGTGAAGMATAGTGGTTPPPAGTGGTCCPTGDCICRGEAPTELTVARGEYDTDTFSISGIGTVHYPTDAEPPFSAVAICGGLLNTGPEMADWGPFYASHGIVTIITTTGGSDQPALRGTKLLAAVERLKAENMRADSPLMGKLAGRYGTSGYSMGGGGTTIAASRDMSLKSSVGLAPYGGTGSGVTTPTLLLCGSSDGTAPCSMARGDYMAIPDATPKMVVTISGGGHLTGWFGPTGADRGASGEAALAFQKVFLEGDERWKPLLTKIRGMITTNIM